VERGEEGAAPELPPPSRDPAPLPVILAAILQVPNPKPYKCAAVQRNHPVRGLPKVYRSLRAVIRGCASRMGNSVQLPASIEPAVEH
jgi:hypothetical protein